MDSRKYIIYGNKIDVKDYIERAFVRAREDEEELLVTPAGQSLDISTKNELYRRCPQLKLIVDDLKASQNCHDDVYECLRQLRTDMIYNNSILNPHTFFLDKLKVLFATLAKDEQLKVLTFKCRSSPTFENCIKAFDERKISTDELSKEITYIIDSNAAYLHKIETLDHYCFIEALRRKKDLYASFVAENTNPEDLSKIQVCCALMGFIAHELSECTSSVKLSLGSKLLELKSQLTNAMSAGTPIEISTLQQVNQTLQSLFNAEATSEKMFSPSGRYAKYIKHHHYENLFIKLGLCEEVKQSVLQAR